jgi:hypothetical protein
MTGVPMPARQYTNACFMTTEAGDPATAQAQLEAAMAAITTALAGLSAPVTLQPEVEQGVWVLSQQ